MRVLLISAFPPDPAPEANHALHLSEHLAKSGLTVHVLCKNGSIAAAHPNIVVHPVMKDWSWSDVPRLLACLRECQPDVVLLLYIGWVFNHEPMITYLPTYCKRVLRGVPCVAQFEIVSTEAPPRSPLARVRRMIMALRAGRGVHWFFGTLLRDSARVIALSTPHRERLLTRDPGIEEKSVILPPPPLIRFCTDSPDLARHRAREVLGAGPDDFVWVYWGYIYPGKGVETLLRAFRIVSQRNSNARLAFVGGNLEIPNRKCNDYFQMVQCLPGILGIADKVIWTGNFNWDSEEGSRYLYAADACVLPFDYGVTLNSSSLAAASTHGVPVIGTELRVGRDEMLEHGRNIYLCPPRDPELLAEAMQLIGENSNFRERLRSGIRDLAEQWHRWDAMTAHMVGILESAVSSDKAPEREASYSYASTNEKKSRKEIILSARRPHHSDDALPGVQKDNTDLSPLVSSEANGLNNVGSPLVSVIVAAYNVEKYLVQCLDSLVNQTLKNTEIIVINDASTDNSAKIINSYSTRYSNVRVVHCESNRGLATVRNIGMRAARGKYIAFTDADDWADIRLCEEMYRRASEDNSDVLIADATVFYEDSKNFGRLFDHSIRRTLDPRSRTMPFDLRGEPRVLLLEPVAWTKLYKRSFLEKHAIEFEDGMNSYEDICFHFSVLLKAARISLLDKALLYYRMKRPGQISARTNRKVFEVFTVFQKIHDNLSALDVSADIWSMLVRVQLRQFDWLLKDRVQAAHKREFLALVARQFTLIPEAGLREFTRHATPNELSRLLCMSRNWLHIYEGVTKQRWLLFTMLCAALKYGRSDLLNLRRRRGILSRRAISLIRSFINKSYQLKRVRNTFRTVDSSVKQLVSQQPFALRMKEPLIETCRINNQLLFLYRCANSGIEHTIRRMQNDYYLTQAAVFREGDTVVDIGAHVGVVSIYLAKKFPFIKIYAIEPEPENFACLTRNIEANGATNVVAINKAVSGDCRQRTLYIDAGDNAWATINPLAAASRGVLRTALVDTITLDRLFQEYGIRHCRLLKIVAPGAVEEALGGITRGGCADLICGEVDLEDCNRVKLEIASWRIARQHFWRTVDQRAKPTVRSWISQLPTGSEQFLCKNS
jgi:FkbM family methyltransferase